MLFFESWLNYHQNANKSKLTELLQKLVSSSPESIHIGIFHSTDVNSLELQTARENEAYVTIALTDLSPDDGWFIFCEGSH